jgi:P2-related tail formation protein
MENILATGIGHKDFIAAYDKTFADRLADIDVSVVLVNLVDSVVADALPYLAKQFDLLGYKGWALADTEQKKRDLIKQAVELHRYKGTPWSIKEALKKVGYPDAQIQEGVGIIHYYDGTINYNGSSFYGNLGHWAYFKVLFNLLNFTQFIPSADLELVTQLILEYKNVRSHLYGLNFVANFEEQVNVNENLEMAANAAATDQTLARFDGTYTYNGSIYYENPETVTITIV